MGSSVTSFQPCNAFYSFSSRWKVHYNDFLACNGSPAPHIYSFLIFCQRVWETVP
uniref:Uncharacterized protein n=1 Tax=Anguilla anguilla TaxID=7936 RepID=A0A0E9RCC9_ANGAN